MRLRIMGTHALGTEGYVVCTGTFSPKRRCEWAIVAGFKHGKDANAYLELLPPDEGRAVIFLDYNYLYIVNRKGEVLQDNNRKEA